MVLLFKRKKKNRTVLFLWLKLDPTMDIEGRDYVTFPFPFPSAAGLMAGCSVQIITLFTYSTIIWELIIQTCFA